MQSPEYDRLTVRQIEAILFVSIQPLSEEEIAAAVGISPKAAQTAVMALKKACDSGRGLTIKKVAGGWQMMTAPDLEETVASFQNQVVSQRVRLSRAALETLSVVAYNQPVTRSEIEEIRTVRCDRVIDTLIKHGLARVAGRKKSVGNPLLYRTTDRFLELFGLESITSLPSLAELSETYVPEQADDWNGDE